MLSTDLFPTDVILWKAFQNGDVRAFEQLYRVHAGPLITYGKRMSSNADQVADAVQDVFLEVWKRRATLTTPDAVRFYLFRVLRNRLIGQLTRTTDPLHQAHDLTDIQEVLSTPSTEAILLDTDTQQECQARLRQAIEHLPPRQREAITLAFYHQFSNEEIGRLMNINTQSATNHVSRGINTLRQLLTDTLWSLGWLLWLFIAD